MIAPARLASATVIALALSTSAVAPERSAFVSSSRATTSGTARWRSDSRSTSRRGGGEVVLFLNVRAVTLANKNVPQHSEAATGKIAPEMIADTIAGGGRVFLCTECTTKAGLKIEERIDGVEPSGPELMKILTAPERKIISY